MSKIILASSSERRAKLLNQLCIPYEMMSVDIDETADLSSEVSPYDIVILLSGKKALYALEKLSSQPNNEPCIIIAADTLIFFNGKVIGKPKDNHDAFETLKMLQGKEHSVYTGVTIIKNWETEGMRFAEMSEHIVDTSKVTMRSLTDDEIWAYVKTGESFGKAGSYAIQDKGAFLIEFIEGDFNSIVGLPLVKLSVVLKKMGVDLTSYWN